MQPGYDHCVNSETNESKVVDGDEFKRGRRRQQPLPPAPTVPPVAQPGFSFPSADTLGVDFAALPYVDVLGGKYKNVLAAQVEAGVVGTDPERTLEFLDRLMLAEQNLRELIEKSGMVLDGRVLAAHREIWQCLERGI